MVYARDRHLAKGTVSVVNRRQDMICGPYSRHLHASFDETAFIAALTDRWSAVGDRRVMIDVGAHVGGSLAHFAKRGWQVYAFEPDPRNRLKLSAFCKGSMNVVVSDRAVSDVADEEVTLYASEVSSGISTLSPFHDSHRAEAVVRTTTLREVVAQNGIKRLDFLKIDVEGLEMKVLAGFPWELLQPSVIECEFEDAKTTKLGYDVAGLADYLIAKGYHVYVSEWHPVLRYGVRHDWNYLNGHAHGRVTPGAWGNLLAFHEQPDEAAMQSIAASTVRLHSRNPLFYLQRPRELRAFARRCVSAFRRRPYLARAAALAFLVGIFAAFAPQTVAWAAAAVAALAFGTLTVHRRFSATDRRLAELAADNGRLSRELREGEKKLVVLEKIVAKAGYANAIHFQPFPREIKPRDLAQLNDVWVERLGLTVPQSAIGYMSFRIAIVESLCVGRLATAIETAVLRTMVAYAVGGAELRVLEIGTLFGVSVGAIYDVCRGRYERVKITVVDPFDGYYGANRADIATDQAVTEPQFRRNMGKVGIDDTELHVIRAYSSDPAAVLAAATESYDVLYIDGDHSGIGVIKDFDLYHGMVRPGGFIVFDDYGTDHWPEIKPAVDEHVMTRSGLEFVGADFRTAVFRVLPAAPASAGPATR